MIGGEEHAHRIRDEQKQLEPDGPLDRVVEIPRPVVVRDDPAAIPALEKRFYSAIEITGARKPVPKLVLDVL